jgi:hypothetical protein
MTMAAAVGAGVGAGPLVGAGAGPLVGAGILGGGVTGMSGETRVRGERERSARGFVAFAPSGS